MIYTGLFKIYDSPQNVSDLNKMNISESIKNSNSSPEIKIDPSILNSKFPLKDTVVSNEITPSLKPSLNKDLIDKGINPTKKL